MQEKFFMKKAVFWYTPGIKSRRQGSSFPGKFISCGRILGQPGFGGANPTGSLFRGNLCPFGYGGRSKRIGCRRHNGVIPFFEPDTGTHRADQSPFCPPFPPSAANLCRTEFNTDPKDCSRHLPQHKGKTPVLSVLLRTGFRQRCFFHSL